MASRKVGKWESDRDALVSYRVVAGGKEGKGRVIVTATSGSHSISDTTFIDVVNRNPLIISTEEQSLASGETATYSWHPESSAQMQISTIPSINFSGAMTFMDNYPHLCTEQLTSKALFMLYGRRFLSDADKHRCDSELPHVIRIIASRQTNSGGFSYWPEQESENEWVTSMVAVMYAEAERQGFRVDSQSRKRLADYQSKASRNYKFSSEDDLLQAFRLYSLVRMGDVPRAAMNRLREAEGLSRETIYYLASCYALTGRTDVAESLILSDMILNPKSNAGYFASKTRNAAIRLEAFVLSGDKGNAIKTAQEIARSCNGVSYVTQDVAFAVIALSQLDAMHGGSAAVKVCEAKHTPVSYNFTKPVNDIALDSKSGSVMLTNVGKGEVQLSFVNSYRPEADKHIKASENGVKVDVTYTDMKQNPIDISSLKQDEEFIAHISVSSNEDIEAVSLSYVIPSGWEIWNERVYGDGYEDEARKDDVKFWQDYEHQDIRDDRVNFYFSLYACSTRRYDVRLRAAYCGSYIMSPTVCEDMYNPSCRAITESCRVRVTQ